MSRSHVYAYSPISSYSGGTFEQRHTFQLFPSILLDISKKYQTIWIFVMKKV